MQKQPHEGQSHQRGYGRQAQKQGYAQQSKQQDYYFKTPKGAIPFMRLTADEDEPDERLFAVEADTLTLSPWAMTYIPNDEVGEDQLLNSLVEFWCIRGDRLDMKGAYLMLSGLVANHPDFSSGVEIDTPIVMVRRATRETLEITEHSPAGLLTLKVVHDLLVATTESGVELAFRADEIAGLA